MLARIAHLIASTEAEGPGRRFAIWFQGCPLRCPGCCNPEYLRNDGGTLMPVKEIVRQIADAKMHLGIEGISLLGGEPFHQAEAAVIIARETQTLGLGVMIYSGLTLAELHAQPATAIHQLLQLTDIVVDGPYRSDEPETVRRWIGSRNQVVHFLSDRYDPADPCWTRPNTLEIRVRGDRVEVNGFPAPQARSLWRRLAAS
jgi:anaerobic ribonucleoside-triphosphate reductase activating protein